MRSVVVTGVAGTLGTRVAALLRHGDIEVVGLDLPGRAASPADAVFPADAKSPAHAGAPAPGVETVGFDLAADEGERLNEVVAGADAIVHLAWQIPEGRGSKSPQHRANEANRRALQAVLRVALDEAVAHIVFVSSATVYGAWPDNPVPLSEHAKLRPNPDFAFGVGKAEAERSVAEWSREHPDVVVTILRPAVTVGGPLRPLYQALGAIRSPRGADANRPVQYLHVDDLASAVALVVNRRLAGVFNVAPDAGVSENVARALAGGLARIALPGRLARGVATWSWQLWRSGIPKEALPYSTDPWVVAADRLRAEGWTPRFSSEEALVATDVRPHWDDLPPGRRQNYTLAAISGGVASVVVALVTSLFAWRRRRR